MHSDRPFLDAIREQPEDDLHRLAWADWLEEHGEDDRATFLRAQLFAASLDETDLAIDALEDQADDLLVRHDRAWAGRIAELALDWGWSRGCIESGTFRGETLLEHGDEIFETVPLRHVRLIANEDDTKRLAACRWLRKIEHLEISTGPLAGPLFDAPYLRDASLQTFLSSPNLEQLTSLDLRGQGVEGPLVQTLIETGVLARLRRLDLSGNIHFGDRATRRVAEAKAPLLVGLGLEGTNLSSFGLQSMLASTNHPSLRNLGVNLWRLFSRGSLNSGRFDRELLQTPLAGQLTSLMLCGLPLSTNVLETLVLSPLAAHLRELCLQSASLKGEAEVGILATAENLTGVRRLELGGNSLRDKGARVLASSPYLTSLVHLGLSANSIGGPGIRALLDSSILDRLRSLDLSVNHVGVPNISALAKSLRPRLLRDLQLKNANLDPECAAILARSPAFARLRSLHLGSNRLGDDGTVEITKSPYLTRLRSLDLDSNEIDSAGARALLDTPRLGALRQLSVRNSSLGTTEREQLETRFGVARSGGSSDSVRV